MFLAINKLLLLLLYCGIIIIPLVWYMWFIVTLSVYIIYNNQIKTAIYTCTMYMYNVPPNANSVILIIQYLKNYRKCSNKSQV